MSAQEIIGVELVVGMEVHIELATRTKMFSRCPNPAAIGAGDAPEPEPNTLIDPVVLGLPGALPVMNAAAIELSMMVGAALNCTIARYTKWDRKSYFYPDLPKAYQISQYDLPLCFDGSVEVPALDEQGVVDPEKPARTIGIIRAHLEEDAGKLLHEAPGGGAIDFSIVDWNRAGTPLLEVVTQPDFRSASECVSFGRMLRDMCRFMGVSAGVMQKGHMRFEPNINCVLTLRDGRTVKTPIVEVKNLNSFKSLRAAVEFEAAAQPGRWLEDGREMGRGMKQTRGWDDVRGETYVQREKEDAHDYRYFPDPDLPAVVIDEAWASAVASRVPELPMARFGRYMKDYGLSAKEAAALVEERAVCALYEAAIEAMAAGGGGGGNGGGRIDPVRAGRVAANLVLQSGMKRANERSAELGRPVLVSELGISPAEIAGIGRLREGGAINAGAADELFGLLCAPGRGEQERDVEALAQERGMIIVRDAGAMEAWVSQAVEQNAQAAADVRAGKMAAIGRLVGAVMKLSGGKADAAAVKAALEKHLRG